MLPEHCRLHAYYRPMQARFADFLNRNGNSEEAREIVNAEQHEIDLYETLQILHQLWRLYCKEAGIGGRIGVRSPALFFTVIQLTMKVERSV